MSVKYIFNPLKGDIDATDKVAFNGEVNLGSQGSPSFFFTGDPNTGIYSPGADQLAISTGGTGRLFVDASGNVGVGAASPAKKLDLFVSGATTTLDGINLSNGTATGFLQTTGATYSYRGIGSNQIWLAADGTTMQVGTVQAHPLVLHTNSFERLRITSDGNVGIGTSSASAPLAFGKAVYAAPSSEDFYRVKFEDVGGIANDVGLGQAGSGTLGLNCAATGNVIFYKGGTETVRVDSSGRVGIGTTSPGAPLDVNGAIYSRSSGVYTDTITSYTGSSISVNAGSSNLNFIVNASERARIDSSGRLLVGTSSAPTGSKSQYSKTAVVGNSLSSTGHGVLSLLSGSNASALTSGTETSQIVFGTPDGDFAYIQAFTDAASGANDYPGRLIFSTTADGASSPTERMRINSNGAVGTFTVDGVTGLNVSTAATAGTATIAAAVRYGATAVYGGTISFQVYSNGNVQNTNNSYGAISDLKLKENIVDANSQWNDLKALQVRNYNFKEGQTHTQIGLIAQEVELVSPGLVSESPDRDEDGNDLGTTTKSVNYSVLYMKAVKALQEAMERIEALEAKVAALEGN